MLKKNEEKFSRIYSRIRNPMTIECHSKTGKLESNDFQMLSKRIFKFKVIYPINYA